MALDEITVVAEPSPASDKPADDAPASHAIPVVEELSDKGREKWLKEPASYPKAPRKAAPKTSPSTDKADSSTADAVDEKEESSPSPSPGQAEVAESASESASGEPAQVGKQPSEAEKRIKSLLSEAKLLKQKLAQYEKPAAAVEPAASKQPEATKEPERPQPDKYKTLDEYFEALSDYKVEKALAGERQRVQEAQQKSAQEQAVKAEREQWNSKIEDARKKYSDFDAIALNPDLPIPKDSAIDWWVMKRPNGGHILYHLGHDIDLIKAINAMPADEAAYTLARIELEVTAESPKPVKAIPQAPPPPREANPKGKVDPMAAALQAGDFTTYRRLKDAEERGKRS